MKPEKKYNNDNNPPTRKLTDHERRALELQIHKNILNGFDEILSATEEWLELESTKNYFFKQSGRLVEFMENSGIRDEWQNIINKRATKGADIIEEVYNYGRNKGLKDIVEYTQTERRIVNNLADYNYELIKEVTEDHVRSIRGRLIDDFGLGVNPRNTNLKEMTELPGIRGWSPEYRAELIARTETARATNIGTLQQYKADGAQFVELIVNTDCDECGAHAGEKVPIDEALDEPIFHPNCKCTWKPATNDATGLRFI